MPSKMRIADNKIPEEAIAGRRRKGAALTDRQVQAAVDASTVDANMITKADGGTTTAGKFTTFNGTNTVTDSAYAKEEAVGVGVGLSGAVAARLDVSMNSSTLPAAKLRNTANGPTLDSDTTLAAATGNGFANTVKNGGTGGALLVDGGTSTTRTVPVLHAKGTAGEAEAFYCEGGERRLSRRVTTSGSISRHDNTIHCYATGTGAAITLTFDFTPGASDLTRRWRIIDTANNAGVRNIVIDGQSTGIYSDAANSKTISAAGQGFDIEVVQTASGTYKFHAFRLARA